MKITDYELYRVHLNLDRPIGDSQVRFTEHWMTVLELKTGDGLAGVGFDIQQGTPTAAEAQQCAAFEHTTWPAVDGKSPYAIALGIGRPRGGNVGSRVLPLPVETAAWDLMGKAAGLPLYQMLGGTGPRVLAYGSTLDFHLSDAEYREWLVHFREMGFGGCKIKVGHPDVEWDLRRMAMAREVMGEEADLMIDANEAWSPKEAIRRLHLYRDAGFDIFWIEDPITRDDYAGYARVCAEVPFTRVNTGEYLGFSGKRRLLQSGGVDVLNVHGAIAMSRAAAHLAGDFGIPVALGNTIMEIGVHLAASLPEVLYLEFSDLAWNRLAREPVQFERGYAIAPDRPGHGIELDRDALQRYRQAE